MTIAPAVNASAASAASETKRFVQDVDALWRAALSRPMHSPACGCAVPSAVRLDPGHLELDIVDYVEDKHALGAHAEWTRARAARCGSEGAGFAAWLESLRVQELLPPALWAQVMAEVVQVLAGIAEHAANRLAPVSAQGQGWLSGKI